MTKKDKTLIFVMLIVFVVGGGYRFLIQPEQLKKEQLTTQLTEAKKEYDEIKFEVDSLPMFYSKFVETEEELITYYPTLDDYREEEDIDRYFTQVVEQATIDMLTFGVTTNEVTYLDDQLITKGFTLTLTGSVENTIALVHTLQNTKDVQIDSIRISDGTGQTDGVTNEASISVNGLVYMKVKQY